MTPRSPNDAPPVVLVVDDDQMARFLARQSLTQAGFCVREAADGEQALASVREQRPDLILLDVDMPRLDGFSACAEVRRMPECVNVPILMVTGLDDTESIDKAYSAGATDFATKPINWALLPHRLRYMLRAGSAVAELAATKARLDSAQRIASVGSWWLGSGDEQMVWSEELYRIVGMPPAPGERGPTLAGLLERVHPEDRERVAAWVEHARQSGRGGGIRHRIVLPDAGERQVQQQVEAVCDSAGQVLHLDATVQDITERRRAEAKIRQLAYCDSLTSLPNRESFRDRLDQALSLARRHARQLAILFLDLDDFKRVNDTLGHTVGDLLLKAVAERLLESVRASDSIVQYDFIDGEAYEEDFEPPGGPAETVARLGGDEFTILLTEIHSSEDAAAVARRILETLSQAFNLAGHEAFITPSIGITLFPRDAEDAETLLKNADLAMYHAKRSGKNLYHFYDKSLNQVALRRLMLDSHLRKALEREEFAVHYQPQLDLADGQVHAAEALLRWENGELGSVRPDEFVPLAEENGQIVQIGEWVLASACRQFKAWQRDGLSISRVAVNISVLQFVRHDFPRVIADILAATGVEAGVLELEITESLLARDVEGAIRTLGALREIGVQLSIDDFGTGYSSLSQLKRFPIDRLKIDRSFVRDITSDPDDAAIATAVIDMAHSMRLRVTAEGVESEAQMRFLQARKCDEVQGFLLSAALAPAAFAVLLRDHHVMGWEGDNADKSVLVVDDDAATRLAVTRVLAAEPYTVLTAANAGEGFELLARHPVSVVVCDYQMPGVNGTEFLTRVRSLYPTTTRVMMSGAADMSSVIKAVNAGEIYKFLEKPLSVETLRSILRDAMVLHEGRSAPDVKAVEAAV